MSAILVMNWLQQEVRYALRGIARNPGFALGVSAWDAGSSGGIAGLLGAVALLATYISARRAGRVDSILCLRAE